MPETTCETCAHQRHELHLVEQGLAQALSWVEELRSERNAAEERLRRQDRVLAQLYHDRLDDRRLLDQQAAWLAEYVGRMLAAEDEVARLRALTERKIAMQINTIRYERLFNTGDYNNQKIMVEATLAEGEDPHLALEQLRTFVAANDPARIEAAQVVADPENHSPWELRKARKLLGLPEPPAAIEETLTAGPDGRGVAGASDFGAGI